MENNLNNINDPLEQLKQAKPKNASVPRVEHLLQKSESRRNDRKRRTFTSRAKFALLATPALMALIAVPMFVANTSSPKLKLNLGEANGTATTNLSLGNGSSYSDCGAVNRRCNDVGLTPAVKWNYTFAPNLRNNSPDGHVYRLSNFGRELEIATMLTEEFNIDKPIVKTVEKISPLETETLYGAGALRDDKRVHVSNLNTATYISVEDQSGKDWVRCQDKDSRRPKENCSEVAFENMPSETGAAKFAQQFLQKLGIVSSIELADLQDNEFLIQVTETRSELSVSASLVLGGEPTASSLYFHWFTGSNNVFMIEGILNRGEDMGLFKTLNSEQAIERLNGYITLPSVRKPFVLSKKSIDGMPWEEKQRLFADKQGNANSTPVEIDVKVTKAVIGLVTIYDLKRNAWVVPGIHYFDETGHLGSVTSLDSDYIQMDEAEK